MKLTVTKSVTCAEAHVRCSYGVMDCTECMTVITSIQDVQFNGPRLTFAKVKAKTAQVARNPPVAKTIVEDKPVTFADLMSQPARMSDAHVDTDHADWTSIVAVSEPILKVTGRG
jgi:hypothetical protein